MKESARSFEKNLKGLNPRVAQLAKDLRSLVLAAVPGMQEHVKNGYSQYGTAEVVLPITMHKGHVNLQFYDARHLTDPDGLLHGEGKRMRHVTLRKPEDARQEYLSRLVREAVEKGIGESPSPTAPLPRGEGSF